MSRIAPTEPGTLELQATRSLADLLWLANTWHGPGGHWFARPPADAADHDHLATAEDAVRYLTDHNVGVPAVPPDARDLADLAAIRDMVRGLVEPAGGWTPAARAVLERTRLRLDADGRLAAEGRGWAAFIGDLIAPLIELVRLRARLSMCRNPACRLMFLDGSKSGTRQWCDDAGCGNRIRLRRHRERQGVA